VTHRKPRQIRNGMKIKFGHDPLPMALYRACTNSKIARDFGARVSFGDQLQYFALPCGQAIQRGRGLRARRALQIFGGNGSQRRTQYILPAVTC